MKNLDAKKITGTPQKQAARILRAVRKHAESRDTAKVQEKRRLRVSKFSEENKRLGIYGRETYKTYRGCVKQLIEFCERRFDVQAVTEIEPQMVEKFVQSKVKPNFGKKGASKSTMQVFQCAFEKAQFALRTEFGVEVDWTSAAPKTIAKMKPAKAIDRSYDAPERVLKEMSSPVFKQALQMQRFGGARVAEISKLEKKQLLGKNMVHLTNCKGGKERVMTLPPDVYDRLEKQIERHGKFEFDRALYRKDIARACIKCGETYHATHGFRYTAIQSMHAAICTSGVSENAAALIVSRAIGHERPSITKYYLKR